MPKAEAKYTIRAQDKTAQGLNSAEGRLRRFGRAITSRVGIAVAGIGTGIAVWGRSLANTAKQLDDVAKRAADLATTAADSAELDLAAELSGTAPEKAARAIERLDRAIADAIEGNRDFQASFALLGLDPRELGAIDDVTERLATFGDALGNIRNERIQSDIRQQFVGRGLGRFFEEGGEGIRQAAAEARRLGLTEGLEQQTKDAEKVLDEWAKFQRVLSDRINDLNAGVLSSDVLANTIRGATNTLAGRPFGEGAIRATEQREPALVPGLQQRVDAPKESTQRQQLAALNRIARTVGRGATYR